MRLRGYDEYEVTLGDQMRGERASLGKTLIDAERDLRIRADMIRAIEDCDLDGFPNDSVVAGYVRSYARYLGLDPEECYRRFCAESGFRSPVSMLADGDRQTKAGMRSIAAAGAALGSGLTQSRFAVAPAPVSIRARVNLGGLASALALMAVIAGLGYGGYALLQDIQRVGFAPLPAAPEVVADAPLIAPPTVDAGLLRRPDAAAYRGDGVLATLAPAEMPPPLLPTRDGPISAIDPATSGVYRDPPRPETQAPTQLAELTAPNFERAAPDQARPIGAIVAEEAAAEAAAAEAAGALPGAVVVHATAEAWVRIRDGEAVIFEGTLAAGADFALPERVTAPILRVGNAGAVFVMVGSQIYGPVGRSGQVVGNLSLLASDVTSQIPQAAAGAVGLDTGSPKVQRAEVTLTQ